MNNEQTLKNDTAKWQQMHAVVSQHTSIAKLNLAWNFKKLIIIRLLTENILTFMLQYVGLMLFGAPTLQTIPPLWFANGITCGFVFMRGFSVLPGIFFGSLLAYQEISNAALISLQSFLLVWLCRRYITPNLVFYNKNKFLIFVCSCVIWTALFTALMFPVSSSNWPLLWLGNLEGILIFACAIVTWDFYFAEIDNLKKQNKIALIFWFGLLFFVILGLIFSHTPIQTLIFSLASMPIIWLIGFRYGWPGVLAALFMFGLLLDFAVFAAAPLFISAFSFASLGFVQFVLFMRILHSALSCIARCPA